MQTFLVHEFENKKNQKMFLIDLNQKLLFVLLPIRN